jgi:hypothetical protein
LSLLHSQQPAHPSGWKFGVQCQELGGALGLTGADDGGLPGSGTHGAGGGVGVEWIGLG